MKKNTNLNEELILLTLKEACQFLRIKESRCRNLLFKNEIPVLRIGRTLRFDKNDLVKWINSKKQYKF